MSATSDRTLGDADTATPSLAPAASGPAGSASAVKLLIRHRTRYRYSAPVKESFNELRLQPVSNEHQTCEDFQLRIEPQVAVRRYLDFYRNWVHHFDLAAPHTALVVGSRTRVTTNRANWLDPDATPTPLTRLPELARMERCFDYLPSSDQIGSDPAVWRLAVDATVGQTDLWQAAQALNRFVHSHLTYTPGPRMPRRPCAMPWRRASAPARTSPTCSSACAGRCRSRRST